MSMPSRTLSALSDIDGLRALAVSAVVLFHLDIAYFHGGFLGVDIFFVVSGFLITGLIQDRLAVDNFRFRDFYARRIRRLFPAIYATVGATLLASWLLLQPSLLQGVAQSGASAILNAANIFFFLEAGYWDVSSSFKPLLHLWSLGVEEQFYLLWPLLITLLFAARAPLYLSALLGGLGLSLTGWLVYSTSNEPAAFYLLPFRVWQFCVGAIALVIWRQFRGSLFVSQILRSAGLALCVFSIITLDAGAASAGWTALLPTTGAALVLIAADSREPSPWLRHPAVQWVGTRSFAIYLAHWPIITLYKTSTLSSLNTLSQFLLGIFSLFTAALLHRYVEQRFYQRNAAARWDRSTAMILASGLALLAVLVLVAKFPDEFSTRKVLLTAEAIDTYNQNRFQRVAGSCRIDQLQNKNRCPENLVSPILVIGNSHEPDGFHIMSAALGGGREHTLVNFGSINGCDTLRAIDHWAQSDNPDCQGRLNALEQSITAIPWQAVILSNRRPTGGGSTGPLPAAVLERKKALINIIATIKAKQPATKVIVFGDYLSTVHDCALLINQYQDMAACSRPHLLEPPHWGGLPDGPLGEDLAEISDDFFNKMALLCASGEIDSCEVTTPEGHPIAMDQHHLTFEFATYIGQKLKAENPDWLKELRE